MVGKPTPEQLARINQLARTPLTEDQVYVFPAKMAGDGVVPNRYERLTPNFLSKMAQQAKSGVSLLLDHSWSNIGTVTVPVGRTFDSKMQQDGDELAFYADHYMRLGQTIQGTSTDDLASGIDAGTIFDTSIGFYVTKHVCSICQQNYYGGDCMHVRGIEYDGKTCIVDLDDGGLMENSLVFDGAYPGAGVVNMSTKDQTTTQAEYTVLSDTTKSLPGDGRVFYSFSSKSGLVGYVRQSAQTEPERNDFVNELEQARQQLSVANSVLSRVREVLGTVSDDAIEAAVTALKSKAQLGEQYRTKVIDEACAAGVRAQGEAFNVEAMKSAYSHLSVAEVEKIRDSYEAHAKTALGGGGKHVETQNHDLPDNPGANPQATGGEMTYEQQREQARKAASDVLKRTGNAGIMKEAR